MLPSDGNNLRLDYGSSATDLRQRFTFSPTYLIPGIKSPRQMLRGWSVNAILTLQTGLRLDTLSMQPPNRLAGNRREHQRTVLAAASPSTGITADPRSRLQPLRVPNAIPCYGKYTGWRDHPLSPRQPPYRLPALTAAQAPYAGDSPTPATRRRLPSTNGGCYIQNGGILARLRPTELWATPTAGMFAGPNYRNVDFSVAQALEVEGTV